METASGNKNGEAEMEKAKENLSPEAKRFYYLEQALKKVWKEFKRLKKSQLGEETPSESFNGVPV